MMIAKHVGARAVRVAMSAVMALAVCPLAGAGALAVPTEAQAASKVFYAALDDEGTLTFTASRPSGGTVYEVPENANFGPDHGDDFAPWWNDKESIRTVKFKDKIQPTSMTDWFFRCYNLSKVQFGKLDTSKCTSMSGLFFRCDSLESVDLSSLDTSKVDSFDFAFGYCENLRSVKMKGKVTKRTESLANMFNECSSLSSVDVSGWDTSNVRKFAYLFAGCASLKSIDITGFDTSKAETMEGMFAGCSSLGKIDLSKTRTPRLEDVSGMFNGCSSIKELDLRSMDFSNAYLMYDTFANCTSLKHVRFSRTNVPGYSACPYLFYNCSSLEELDLSPLQNMKGWRMRGMFQGCSKLVKLDISNFDTAGAEMMDGIFKGCDSLRSVKLGDKFSFESQDELSEMYGVAVGERFDGSDLPEGEWVSSADGKVYAEDAIPSKVAATYTMKGWVDDSADESVADDPAKTGDNDEPVVDEPAGNEPEKGDADKEADTGKTTETKAKIVKAKGALYQYQRMIMTPEDINVKLKWKSSNKKVATVKTSRDAAAAKKGGADLVAKKPGKVTLTGTAKGCKVTVKLTVKKTKFKPVALKKLANYKELSKYMSKKQFKKAYKAAVKVLRPLGDYDRDTQIQEMYYVLRNMAESGKVSYSGKAKHYNDPYGYFVKGKASCAGATRAAGLCLNILGYKYKHVNANQYTHQWCEAKVGKHTWTVDVFGGACVKD